MTHLSPEQLIDLVEERADPGVVSHARTCDRCQTGADALRDTLGLAAIDPAHEPSPLFWDHLASRVGAAVRAEAEKRERRAAWIWRWGPVSALGAAVLVVVWVGMPRETPRVAPGAAGGPGPAVAGEVARAVTPRVPERVAQRSAGNPAAAVAAMAAPIGLDQPAVDDDASWLFVRDLSQEFTVEEAGAALPAGPGAADRALGQLSDDERAALVDLIRAEMARGSVRSPEPSGEYVAVPASE